MFRIIWPNSKGDVLNCFMGDKISSLGSKGGTWSLLPETVAFSAKKLLKILAFSWLSVMTSPFSIIGGTEDTF